MTWKETNTMNEKLKFIAEHQSKRYSFTELCNKFEVSRKTGYKLLRRYEEYGVDGLKEFSRAHHSHPLTTSDEIVKKILQAKQRFPHWGPKKLDIWLQGNNPEFKIPSVNTIEAILDNHGLVKRRKKRARVAPYTNPFVQCNESNSVWSADFKGQFRLGNGRLCYPMTISDNYSRLIIGCKGLHNPTYLNTKFCFELAFKEYGLPNAIRTDNGVPFSSTSIAGLSQLSIWWIKLGIIPERIKAGHPEQNGRHERMHRTLKQCTANPPKQTMEIQQKLFDNFIYEFNTLRPHEALSGETPSNIYSESTRPMPNRLPEIEYGNNIQIRKVRSNGQIKWDGQLFYLSELLYGEPVGLEEIDNGLWQIYFSQIKLGKLDLKKNRIIRHA